MASPPPQYMALNGADVLSRTRDAIAPVSQYMRKR